MKKEPYASPVIELCTISKNDILLGSNEVMIDGSRFFQDQEQE